jgi:hypothetical protein
MKEKEEIKPASGEEEKRRRAGINYKGREIKHEIGRLQVTG